LNMSKAILNNLEIWHKYKQRLYDNSIFKHDYSNNSHVTINSKLLDAEENQLLNKILTYLNNINGIDFVNKNGIIEVTFKNNYLKGFIFKSGTWLEVLTSKVLQEIRDMDEVKKSVIFFGSEDARRVKNELDVLAVKDSRLICVSCKDSDKYDDNALNELEVYSEKLGGDITVKILVATKPPVKKSVVDRAKEMNINLIIFDKDIDKFKKTIMGILNRR
ncbi:Card1-like endonuclease domain-containing protein, partial [Gemella morbillorum]